MEFKFNSCSLFMCLCLTNLGSPLKYEYINDCYFYNRGDTPGIDNVTFTCTENDRENSVFISNTFECSNYFSAVKRFWVGTIDFKNCKFSTIRKNFFEMFYNMHTFIISKVELETLQMDIFREARNVSRLDVSQNKLNEIPELIFFNAAKLKYVNFFNNSIKRIDLRAFEGAIKLETLNLSNNRINAIDSRTFILPTLLTLDLSNNNLTKFDDHTFEKLMNLKQLNLSFNNMSNLDINTFVRLINLETLSLRRTNLSKIQLGTFSHQHKLVSLDLSENNLKKLDFKIFFPILKDLRSLRLSRNQLKDLDGFRNSLFPQLNSLHIQGNQFNCSYLLQFMESVNWEKIHFDLDISSIDATNKSNIRGIGCEITNAEENEDGTTAEFNEQFTAKTERNLSNGYSPAIFIHVDDSIAKISQIFICIAMTIFIVLFIIANFNKIRNQFPRPSITYHHSQKENVVEFTNDRILLT